MIVENLQTTTDANQIDIIFGIILFMGGQSLWIIKIFRVHWDGTLWLPGLLQYMYSASL